MCDLLDIQPKVEYTSSFLSPLTSHLSPLDDFREVINVKHPQADADFQPRRYWQVFEGKHGFQANLSILDLLFNMGNEAVFYL